MPVAVLDVVDNGCYTETEGIMFLGLGPTELIFILALALIIFGPKRLPEIARSLGKAIGEVKKASQGIQTAVQKDLIEPIGTLGEKLDEQSEKDNEPA
jgi:TatA/E family protein of Tat protein translocase